MEGMTHVPPTAWTTRSRALWGKTVPDDPHSYLSLAQHLDDSGAVAGRVWEWLPQRVQHTIEAGMPADARDGRTLLRWLAAVHDIGKATCPFQAQVPLLADHVSAAGLTFYPDPTDFRIARHALAGQHVVNRWLAESHGATRRVANSYSVVVGGHHGVPPTKTQLLWMLTHEEILGDTSWRAVQDEILQAMARRTGADVLLDAWMRSPLAPTAQALLTGAVIVSDWLASNTDLFPIRAGDQASRAESAWEALALPPPWAPVRAPSDVGAHLMQRFPAVSGDPRPVQRATVAAAWRTSSASLLIVESAMGSGKTEAALLAAEVLAERHGCGGVFIGLPTMATSDGMFRRVLDWIGTLDGHGLTSTFLAHGKAGLNDDFRGLQTGRSASIAPDEDDPGRLRASAEAWLSGRKKGVLSTMVVGTVDQLLFLALQARHVALRHLALAGKVVVIDEVHAADEFMAVYLRRALEWLASYGVPVVLLSATLPARQRQTLADAYRRGLEAPSAPLPEQSGYPMVTSVGRNGAQVDCPADTTPPVDVAVRLLADDDEALVELLDGLVSEGGCVAVIRNTVRRAQRTADLLHARWGDEVVLHHSRYLATHRAAREATLRGQLGPHPLDRPRRLIVVGTQVLEQSLDIDFDAMVTDLAPVDLVLQRAGRLHRHDRDRPSRLSAPVVYVTALQGWAGDGPALDRGGVAVYGESKLLRAAIVLDLAAGGRSIQLPRDIRDLVESAYDPALAAPDGWSTRLADADRRQRELTERARREAAVFLLPGRDELADDLGECLVGMLADTSAEADDGGAAGAARVRDGDESVEVVVAQRIDGQVCHVADGRSTQSGRAAPDIGPPDPDLARALAGCTVRLPPEMTRSAAALDQVIDALERDGIDTWQQSKWLQGQLVLVLDEHWRRSLAGFDIHYDQRRGLSATLEETA